MKRNDITKLHSLTLAELHKKLKELNEAVAKARLEKKANKLANPRLVSAMGDDIARVLTVIRQKEMEA